MKNKNFRSIEFWKASIMVLPDNAFFELLRTVFGKVKTPFNKQMLLGDLEQFLSRPDIQQNIAGYINSNDSRVIAAVAVLNEPVPKDLETFFAGELSYAELNDIVVNLEERFILYRFLEEKPAFGFGQGSKHSRLALNPVLGPIFLPFIDNTSLLFPSVSAAAIPAEMTHTAVLDDRILAALLSFVANNELFFKYGGSIRRKVINAAETLFPGFALETIIGGLQVLGLFNTENESLLPNYHHFTALGSLSFRNRMEYCAAGILCYWDYRSNEQIHAKKHERSESETTANAAVHELSPWLLRAKVRKYASFLHRFNDSLDPQRLYPFATLQKIAHITGRDSDVTINDQSLINAGVLTGLLVQVSDQYWQRAPKKEPAAPDSVLVMDTPFTFLAYPGIAYSDIIKLAAASCVVETGSTVRFELSRDSIVAALDRGISAAEIIELLQRLSGNRIDENLIFTLTDWEKRYSEVALRRGLVLTLSPEQRHLAQTKPLAKLIVETIAPGIYLLPETAEEKAVEVLRKAGAAIVARRRISQTDTNTLDSNESVYGTLRSFYPAMHDTSSPSAPQYEDAQENASAASTLIEQFHSILKGMRLAEEEQDELSARINRRLVLCESQLKGAVIRYEKLEARGLDYVGKALIAKQAISMQSAVEIAWPGRQQERIFGIPKTLEKTESESILVIDPLDGRDIIRIPLGKISVLRRIKKSIFEV